MLEQIHQDLYSDRIQHIAECFRIQLQLIDERPSGCLIEFISSAKVTDLFLLVNWI